MKIYNVKVIRTSYAEHVIAVEANGPEEAEYKALTDAGDYFYHEYNADYSVGGVTIK